MLHLLHLVAALCLLCSAGAGARAPNFLFLITDDQDKLALPVMPALRERVVAQGLSFEAAHTSSPICCPSRTSLFSGRYSHNLNDPVLGWCGNFSGEEEDNFLLGLSNAGYRVAQHGKWFNQEVQFSPPYVPRWHGARPGNDFFVMTEEGVYINNTFNSNGAGFRCSQLTPGGSYLTSCLGNRTSAWLREATAGDSPVPWVAYVAPHAPHLPATPAPWYADAALPSDTAPRTPAWNVGWEDKHWQIDNGIDKPMSPALIAGSDALWRARLRTLMSVDDLLAEALDIVEGAGAWTRENTFIIHTSDHGYHLGAWGLWSEKAQAYDADTKVPLAVRGPGVARGAVSHALVTNIDLPPTLLELAGAPNGWPTGAGERRDGVSLVPLLAGGGSGGAPPPGWRDRLLIEFVGWQSFEWLAPCAWGLTPQPCTGNASADASGLINAQSNNYVALRVVNDTADTLIVDYRPPLAPLARAQTNYSEAFDVAADPWTLTNLAVKGRMPADRLLRMRDELWAVATCAGASCP